MITIEQIDEFRKRTNSSYEDAKYYLEKNDGDILNAIIDFERAKSGKTYYNQQKKGQNDFGQKFADILQKGFDTRIVVEDKNTILFTIPVIFLILLIPLWIFALLFFLFLVMLGYKFSIRDIKNENVNVNSFFQNINDKMKEGGMNKDKTNRNTNADSSSVQNPESAGSAQVPVPSDTEPPQAPETEFPTEEQDDEEGFKEYTIE